MKKSNEFDRLINDLKAKNIFSMRDAIDDLKFTVTLKDIENAVPKDQSNCVVAKGIKTCQLGVIGVSIGPAIAKIVLGTGEVVRYKVPAELRNALKDFDKLKGWNLPAGDYHLKVPDGAYNLKENQTEDRKNKNTARWKKFSQRFKSGKTNGKGITQYKSKPIDSREVTITRGSPRKAKA